MKSQEVCIFFPDRTGPELTRFYTEGLAYLSEAGIKPHIVDVIERPKLAEKYKIMATLFLLINRNNETRTYVSVIHSLKQLLATDFGTFGDSTKIVGKIILFFDKSPLQALLKTKPKKMEEIVH